MPLPLPSPLLEDVLNARQADVHRADMRRQDFRIHVSDLIKSDLAMRFCPREMVLAHFEGREQTAKVLPPGFELLYAMGNTIHDLVRTKYTKSQRGASAWGTWTCACGKLKREGCSRPNVKLPKNTCAVCSTPATHYREYSLYLHKYRLVGHPDFIIKWEGKFYIVEIKTVDRQDVVFDELRAPLGDHHLQASFYYYMMRDLGYNVSPDIIFVYVDRSTSKLWRSGVYKEFRVRRCDAKRIIPFLAKCTAIINAVENKTLPARICQTHKASRAKNCASCLTCFERQGDTITYATALAPPVSGGDGHQPDLPSLGDNGHARPKPVRPHPRPRGKKTRLDPQQHDLDGYPQQGVVGIGPGEYRPPPGRLRFRSAPTSRIYRPR